MKQSAFTLEFITPAMLSGALPKGQGSIAELRVPSIRGQLRWWFRALGGSDRDEIKCFGSIASERGQASSIFLRISKLEDCSGALPCSLPIQTQFKSPMTARDIGATDMNTSGYLAFNLRSPQDARSMIPAKTRFVVEARAARFSSGEYDHFCQVFRMFATFGSLGARSRRTFGSLRLVSEIGDLPAEPAAWENFPARHIDWQEVPGGSWPTVAELRRAAGTWLKMHRNNPSVLPKWRRGEVFGHAGRDCPSGEKRRASSVILRPMLEPDGTYSLGLIIPRPAPQLISNAIQ